MAGITKIEIEVDAADNVSNVTFSLVGGAAGQSANGVRLYNALAQTAVIGQKIVDPWGFKEDVRLDAPDITSALTAALNEKVERQRRLPEASLWARVFGGKHGKRHGR